MNTANRRFEHEGLAITVSKSGRYTWIVWSGVSDSRSPGTFLNPLIEQLVKETKGLDVVIDCTALEYMNSATVSPLLHCIRSMDAEGTAVTVRFTDADWQRTHLQCLRSIARTLSRVRVEAKAAL
jgi:hypothetical protein